MGMCTTESNVMASKPNLASREKAEGRGQNNFCSGAAVIRTCGLAIDRAIVIWAQNLKCFKCLSASVRTIKSLANIYLKLWNSSDLFKGKSHWQLMLISWLHATLVGATSFDWANFFGEWNNNFWFMAYHLLGSCVCQFNWFLACSLILWHIFRIIFPSCGCSFGGTEPTLRLCLNFHVYFYRTSLARWVFQSFPKRAASAGSRSTRVNTLEFDFSKVLCESCQALPAVAVTSTCLWTPKL